MTVGSILATLALLSLGLTLWQWLAAKDFPFDRRVTLDSPTPPVTLLKPLHGADDYTEGCLQSWFAQDYPGPVQILFGVAHADDPAALLVNQLMQKYPQCVAQLVVCSETLGPNPKVSKLAQMFERARHDIMVLSDADVFAPADCLRNLVAPLADAKVGIVNCFYRMKPPATAAMRWEAVAVNADFWSQVLQARSLGTLKFALGATLAVRRDALRDVGGFNALVDCLADDYELGRRVAACGHRIEFCPVVNECRESPRGWRATWRHQLRWARTIRVCQPTAYFASILSNATLWPLAWLMVQPSTWAAKSVVALLIVRVITAADLMRRLTQRPVDVADLLVVPLKDLLQAALWVGAFVGNSVEWRGENYRVQSDGGLSRGRETRRLDRVN